MRRALAIAVVALTTLLVGSQAALAQYGPAPTTTAPPTTTSTTAPTTTTTINESRPPRGPASLSDHAVDPGQLDVLLSVAPDSCLPGTTATARFVRLVNTRPAGLLGTTTADADGSAEVEFDVDDAMPAGVYLVFLQCQGPDGRQWIYRTVMVVKGPIAASGVTSQGTSTPLPADIEALADTVTPDVEANIAEAVADGGTPSVVNNAIRVDGADVPAAARLGTTGTDTRAPVTVGAALILAGIGLYSLRRRKEAQEVQV